MKEKLLSINYNLTLGVVLAFFFAFDTDIYAVDGKTLDTSIASVCSVEPCEFRQSRAANSSSGKLLLPENVVYNSGLSPDVVKKDYFGKRETLPRTFVKDGSLFIISGPEQGTSVAEMYPAADTVCVARGGDGIVYGEAVSRHEWGIDNGVFPAPDGSKLAFYRKDESRVALFPFLDINSDGAFLKTVRYPMNGCNSEHINLGIYDLVTGKTIYLETDGEFSDDPTQSGEFDEHYITCVTWSPDCRSVYLQELDRSQKNVRLNRYDANSGKKLSTVLTEHSDTWVEPRMPLAWINGSDNLCVYCTDNRDGNKSLYLLDVTDGHIKRLTTDPTDAQYVSNDGKFVYYTAPDSHPVNNYLWKVNIRTGKIHLMTPEKGWHTIYMSPDCKSYVDVYEALDIAPESRLKSTLKNTVTKILKPSSDPTLSWAYTEIEMGTVPSANGKDLNYYRMVKPLNFDPSKKYPLILYVYGGPHSQLVTNTFLGGLRRWEMYAAQKGFVVFVLDGRGTSRHNTAYEHSIYGRLSECEMQDQMQAISMLREIPWIDSGRIGVSGWSYGGFMSLSLATTYPEIFKVAVAGGPVIDWRWYEVMYGERYMGRHQDSSESFERNSLLNKASSLKAKTLVIQGNLDDTVVPLNALSFIQKCVDCNIGVDYFTYPNAFHNMKNNDRVHLVEKITDYFIDNLNSKPCLQDP